MEKLRRGPLPDGFKNVGKHFLRLAPTSVAVVLAVACSGEKDSNSTQLQVTPRVGESGALPNPENPFAVLEMPFPKDSKMAIQQGWFYTNGKEHKGVDFIKGDIDNSRTWKSFPVKAAADGKACANPPSQEGKAVLITHSIGETFVGSTYYGHLQESGRDIPECDTGQTVFKRKGDKIGDAGSDGAEDQSWIHLHFQVNARNGNPIDPYDLRGKRDVYPKPDSSDVTQKSCGPKALFTGCYPKGAVVAGPKDRISPISGQITSKGVKNLSIKDLEKNGWRHISSKEYPFEIMAPPEWKVFFDKESSMLKYEPENQNLFYETVIIITSDPLESGTTFEGYIKNRIRTGTGVDRNGNSNGDAVRGTNANVDKSLLPLLDLRIAGQETAFIYDPRDINAEKMKVQVDFIGNDRTWTIWLTIPSSSKEQVPIIKQILSSFKFIDKPTPIVEKQTIEKSEKKISISKKPDELFRALLTNPISPNILPQGMSLEGTSAGEIDATGKALKQVGGVTIKIEDSVSTPARGTPNGAIDYAIFPDSSTAKNASDIVGTHLGNGQVLKDFPYPAKIYTLNIFGGTIKIALMSVENVTVIVTFAGTDPSLLESRAISLGNAAIEHLGKVGK